MSKKQRQGISLIVLVITIIVILILSGAIIFSFSKNNPIAQANKAVFLNDLRNFQHELSMYETGEFADKLGAYDPKLLQADETSAIYDGNVIAGKTMNDFIPSLARTTKYAGKFKVVNGELVFQELNNNEPNIAILPPNTTVVASGTDVTFIVKFSSNVPLKIIDLTGKLELIDNAGVLLSAQPAIIVGTISGTNTDLTRQVDITVKTNTLINGSYKLKIKSGVVTNANGNSNTTDKISPIGFDINTTPPTNPTMSANPSTWTNGDVSVTITYSSDSTVKEYSLDSLTWQAYYSPIVVSTNNTTVYARGKNNIGIISGIASLTVSNIDKMAPTVTASNGGTTTSSVTVTATASDTGGSGLNTTSYQYSKDNGVTWTTATNQTSYTFDSLTTGTYQCKVKVVDNAGNIATSAAVSITTKSLGTITMSANPSTWTNENVTVTITYPTGIILQQYSLDGTTWRTYTSPVIVNTNNTTVYARGLDDAGNQTLQSTVTVSNIDKEVPTIIASNGGTTTSSITVTAVASDTGESGINTASYQYSKDNGATWTIATNATSYTFTGLTAGTYECMVKVVDNARNTTTSSAVSLTTQIIGTITMNASPTTWTNGNVTVTITYPTGISTKQYSLDGTTWQTYMSPVVLSSNNTTVYAKGVDAGGNQAAQATLTVSNIDKTAPTVTASNGGTTTSSVTVTATSSDTGGSGIDTASYQYSKDNGTTWTTATNATSYTFTGLTTGTYQCKVKVADNAGNITTSTAVAIATQSLGTITMSASPTTWTNGNVTVTITYPTGVVTQQYSTNGTTWITYTSPIVVSTNNTTVYAKGLDAVGNQTAQATLTVSNIDKTAPTVTGTSGGITSSSVTVTATASDTGGSGLNTTSYQYSKDNGTTWTTATNATSYTFTGLTTGTYQCKVKVADNAGNIATSSVVAITTQALGIITMSASPTTWTKGNVTVTITYPTAVVTKQYSLDGTTWQTYTSAVAVSTNGVTVYAKGLDAGGNQTAQATLTVSNIDINAPTVLYGTNGGINQIQVSTTVTVNDSASGVNTSSLQYIWDTQNLTIPSSGWTTFTNGSTLTNSNAGISYLWIKGNDTAGNSVSAVSNLFGVGDLSIAVSTLQNINKTFAGDTSGYSYNNPVIPAGFVAVNTAEASWNSLSTDWNKGLVIQDSSGNQFVWVPVDGTTVTYGKWCTNGLSYASTTDDSTPFGFSDSKITTTYKGFYIARYESMFDYNGGSIRVASKKSTNKTTSDWSTTRNATYNGYLWNFITYIDSKTYAENMATSYGYNTTLLGTNLITGAEWDTVMKWIQNSGISVTDSKTWGNYSNPTYPANITGYGSLQISGYSSCWRVKNIYDLAGNTFEWSSEKYYSGGWQYIMRGGAYYNMSPAAIRGSDYDSKAYYTTSRVALYVL